MHTERVASIRRLLTADIPLAIAEVSDVQKEVQWG